MGRIGPASQRDLRDATLCSGEGERRNRASPSSRRRARRRSRRSSPFPAIVLLFALPAFASRVLLQELFYVFTMLSLAQLWNLLAGCAGLISVGQQAFVGVGAYALFAFTVIEGFDAVLVDRARPARRRRRRRAGGADRVPPARRLFRHRHLGRRRGLPARPGAGEAIGRRHRDLAADRTSRARCSASIQVRELLRRARAGGARHACLLAGAPARARHVRCWSTGCCARATDWRFPPSAMPRPRPRAPASTSSAPSS